MPPIDIITWSNEMKKKTFKYDMIVIFVIGMIIIGFFVLRKPNQGHFAKITIGKDEYGVYDLNKDQTININNENILIIKNNEIYMDQATCPDKNCIRQGHIFKSGASIICLPHQVIVEIIDGEEDNQDEKVY